MKRLSGNLLLAGALVMLFPCAAHEGSHADPSGQILQAVAVSYDSKVSITEEGAYRLVVSNGIPAHSIGRFPNSGNPNAITPQDHAFRIALAPQAG